MNILNYAKFFDSQIYYMKGSLSLDAFLFIRYNIMLSRICVGCDVSHQFPLLGNDSPESHIPMA